MGEKVAQPDEVKRCLTLICRRRIFGCSPAVLKYDARTLTR
jgi:hypothetical protein